MTGMCPLATGQLPRGSDQAGKRGHPTVTLAHALRRRNQMARLKEIHTPIQPHIR